jgi:cysteine sulfinate desulfinase/cysteine desulfurase-like protein
VSVNADYDNGTVLHNSARFRKRNEYANGRADTAIGLSRQEANSTIRVGIGRFTTEDDISQAVGSLLSAYDRLSQIRV